MTKKEKIIMILSLVMLLSGAGIVYLKSNTGHSGKIVSLSTVKQADGWGYTITAGKDYVIEQNCIPGITGYKTFINEQEALKAGRKVVEKLQQGLIPALTIEELRQMQIHFQ
jgi:outer membrane protein W